MGLCFAMVASKPQIRAMFATPVCVHFHPLALEINAELRALVLERAEKAERVKMSSCAGWRSGEDFTEWGGVQGQTLFRMLHDLADDLTAARSGGRVTVDWKIRACASVHREGCCQDVSARAGAFWSGVYYVDDGYHKSDDEGLGGEYELADPRGVLPATIAPQFAYRMPGGLSAGFREAIRPQSGMIIMHPSWLPCGERRFRGTDPRVVVEFDISP